MNTEFKSFNKILHIGKLYMSITQKIHGSNAQIHIYKDENEVMQMQVGSRSRWLDKENDNYGFFRFCDDNRCEIIEKLGEGRHFGEWAGPGINVGEGLQEKILVLFNWKRFIGKELPSRMRTVPLLYKGCISLDAINSSMEDLKKNGSLLVPGYMNPEGIVVDLDGHLYKNVFDNEEVKWKEVSKNIKSSNNPSPDIGYLLQPRRLEKLLSKDEQYIINYPSSLSSICSAYVKDLEEENQFLGKNEEELRQEKKSLGKEIYYFIKSIIGAIKND